MILIPLIANIVDKTKKPEKKKGDSSALALFRLLQVK
jgi:hypothetical protein